MIRLESLLRRAPLLALALIGFSVSAPGVAGQAGVSLAGRWNLTLWVDSADGSTKTVAGTIVLVEVKGSERPTYRGSYQVPLSTIGLSPDAAPVTLTQNRDESFRITLNPAASGKAELSGSWSRGMITGRWQWVGGPERGGRFQLQSGR